MYITSMDIKDFRNIEHMNFQPCEGMNVFFGQNGQGKTNILESIWLMNGYKSFRTNHTEECVRFGTKVAEMKLTYKELGKDIDVALKLNDKRIYTFNEQKIYKRADIIGAVRQVIFTPKHLDIIQEGPAARRLYLDNAICQIKPQYIGKMAVFMRAMRERNSIIVDAQYNKGLHDYLEVLEAQMAEAAMHIVKLRFGYVTRVNELAQEIYEDMTGGTESISLRYAQNFTQGENFLETHQIAERLIISRKSDVNSKRTSVGPHADDIKILIDGKDARRYASQGQQRTAALAMKLAEAIILESNVCDRPLILLDDVLSELDEERQDYIMNNMSRGRQMFVTCCDKDILDKMKYGKMFEISGGKIIN